ncbi:hypothetical protein Taro_028307 [Colocasia esculenta]|uniref:Uncharacterized protein n=1 Tax=Colocasia esculenta TaxID=4460 RepID=A0A843VI90_COLES|nr:hypothetical protein [Colocasia esculenta]
MRLTPPLPSPHANHILHHLLVPTTSTSSAASLHRTATSSAITHPPPSDHCCPSVSAPLSCSTHPGTHLALCCAAPLWTTVVVAVSFKEMSIYDPTPSGPRARTNFHLHRGALLMRPLSRPLNMQGALTSIYSTLAELRETKVPTNRLAFFQEGPPWSASAWGFFVAPSMAPRTKVKSTIANGPRPGEANPALHPPRAPPSRAPTSLRPAHGRPPRRHPASLVAAQPLAPCGEAVRASREPAPRQAPQPCYASAASASTLASARPASGPLPRAAPRQPLPASTSATGALHTGGLRATPRPCSRSNPTRPGSPRQPRTRAPPCEREDAPTPPTAASSQRPASLCLAACTRPHRDHVLRPPTPRSTHVQHRHKPGAPAKRLHRLANGPPHSHLRRARMNLHGVLNADGEHPVHIYLQALHTSSALHEVFSPQF